MRMSDWIADVCSSDLGSVAIGTALLVLKLSQPPPLATPFVCEPLPPNVKQLGPALGAEEANAALDSYASERDSLKIEMRPGDTVHPFETAVTGGQLVMRGDCYIGQAVDRKSTRLNSSH